MTKVDEYMTKKIAAGKNNGCTLETAGVRREWYGRPKSQLLYPSALIFDSTGAT